MIVHKFAHAGVTRSEQPAFPEAHVPGSRDDDMVDERDADQRPRLRQLAGDGIRKYLPGVDEAVIQETHGDDPVPSTSPAPLRVVQMKCSCRFEPRSGTSGRISSGFVTFAGDPGVA